MSTAETAPIHCFTVDQYRQMIAAGVLTKYDRVQLLEGRIVDKMPHNPPHDACVAMANGALAPFVPADWHVRIQSAITTRDSQPEPDLAVVSGPYQRYARRHPGPKDIGMLVEVGDSTLRDDQTIQYRIFARSRIPIYWIINLVDERVEVYTEPRSGKNPQYLQMQTYVRGESVPFVLGGKQLGDIDVNKLLPDLA